MKNCKLLIIIHVISILAPENFVLSKNVFNFGTASKNYIPTQHPEFSTFEPAHQLRFAQNVPLQRRQHLGLVRPGLEVQNCIERIEPEEVSVRFARRRARTAVAHTAEAGRPLHPAGWKLTLFGSILVHCPSLRWQVVDYPVRPSAGRCVGIFHNQRKATRATWRVRPGERRRYILSLARKAHGDKGSFLEGRTLNAKARMRRFLCLRGSR